MAEQEDLKLTFLMNRSKIYLHVELLSLKTNGNWQKDSCKNQDCDKDPHIIR